MKRDGYGRGWLVAIEPADGSWASLPRGESAESWMRREAVRWNHFLEERLGFAAADGGELRRARALAHRRGRLARPRGGVPDRLRRPMVRQLTAARTSFADSPRQVHRPESNRRGATSFRGILLRLVVAPFAAIAFLAAGALFVILLPVCGIASIAQGLAAGCWRFLCTTTRFGPRPRVIRG